MSRLGHGFRGASRRMRFQSAFKPSMSSNYTRFASASPFAQPTSNPTITATYAPVFCSMTPASLTMPLANLTDTMEAGSHLIGTGTSSSALAEEEEEDDVVVQHLIICTNYAPSTWTH